MDAEAAGKIAEGAGKIVGVSWLLAHHGRNYWRWWRRRQEEKRQSQMDSEKQVESAQQDEQTGRMLRDAAYQYIDFRHQIEQCERTIILRDQEIKLIKEDRDRQRDMANEYKTAAEFWFTNAQRNGKANGILEQKADSQKTDLQTE